MIRDWRRPAALRSAATGCLLALLAVAPSGAQDPEAPRILIPGKGSDLATARCATCHDAQHITRTKLSRGEWEFNIQNMIQRGAPIAPGEIPVILDYLATYYNRDAEAPAPDPGAASFGMGPGSGDAVQQLLSLSGCFACHTLDKRVVGPSFREVAAKYAADGEAPGKLARKIKDGGAGTWGNIPMPPHPQLSDENLKRLVAWILDLL